MRGRWPDVLWLLAFGVASSVWCLSAATQLGVTFDEPLYVKAGLVNYRTGSNKLMMRAGTMPLPIDVQTLPVHLWEQHRGHEFDPVAQVIEKLLAEIAEHRHRTEMRIERARSIQPDATAESPRKASESQVSQMATRAAPRGSLRAR